MSPFRFIHTADWQLGKPFGRFGPELRRDLSSARIEAIGTIARTARAEGAGHVVVAGDVWDSETPTDETLLQPLDAMAAARDVTWWLLPGNHDPAARHGLWDRLRSRGLPSNVRALCEESPVEAAPGVIFLPAPWRSKNPGRDLTEDLATQPTAEGMLRIGIAHGGTTEFASNAQQSAVIADGAAERAGLDYLALGDWHGHKKVDERCWYAGTPEPDSFPRNEPGYVLSVRVEPGRPPEVTPVKTGRYHWSRDSLALLAEDDPVARFDALYEGGPERRYRLSRLDVTGTVRLDRRAALLAHIEAERARYAFLEADHATLDTIAEADDLSVFSGEASLEDAAGRLLAGAKDPAAGEEARLTARLALDLLMTYAA